IMLIGVHRAQGINNTSLKMLTGLFNSLHRYLQVADIIKSIKNTENIDTCFRSHVNKCHGHIIRIVCITYQILSPQQHLERGTFDIFLNGSDSIPGVLIQVANTNIKSSATPHFQRMISYLIYFFQNRYHILSAHPGSPKALMCISQGGICDTWSQETAPPPV